MTGENLAAVVHMAMDRDDIKEEGDPSSRIDEDVELLDTELSYITEEVTTKLEVSLSNSTYVHGIDDMASDLMTINDHIRVEGKRNLNEITIATTPNTSSVMSRKQNLAYKIEFGRKIPVRPPKKCFGNVVGEPGGSSEKLQYKSPSSN